MANDIEKQVLRLIGEDVDSPDVFSDITPIRDSINDAIQETAIVAGASQDIYYLPLKNDTTFYRLKFESGYFGWVTNAWLVSQNRRLQQTDLIRLGQYNPRWLIDTGSPESYFQIGMDILGVYRRPTGNTEILELTCVVVPDRYTADDERVRIRRDFEWTVIHYAVSEYYASRGDAQEANAWFDRYLQAIGIKSQYPQARERERQYWTGKEPFLVDR